MAECMCPIALHAQLSPHEPALITDDKTWTYRACHSLVEGLCRSLKTSGIEPGARVAFIARKIPHSIFLFFALFRLRAIACPISFREPREKLPELMNRLDSSHFFETEELPLIPSEECTDSIFLERDVATCLLTSGSSGQPKVACHTIHNHFSNALGTIDFFALDPGSRWLLSLPLFHVGGLAILFRIFLTGGAVVLSDLSLLDALHKHPITHLSLVTTQLIRLLREEKKIPEQIRCLLLGGAPIPSLCFLEAKQRGIPLVTTYGMTEMSSIITAAKEPSSPHAGKALPHRECTVSADREILVRGDTLFSGYWDHHTKMLLPGRTDGWFATKDIGEFTQDGDLCILGRKDRLFISGGENIHPEEIERALVSIPGIASATIVPIADPEFGMRPVAFIQDETASHTLDSVREALRAQLPSFKHPVRMFAYPSGENLKISYSYLKEFLQKI